MRGTNSTSEIDDILRRIARDQLGLVTVAQAARFGVDKFALERRRNAGALITMFPGVMRLSAVSPSRGQRILAAALTVRGSTIAATAAAAVHQLPVGQSTTRPTLSVGATTSARTPGIIAIRQSFVMPTQRWHGVRLATPASTLLLLPRFTDAQTVERCLDHSLAHRLTTVAVIRELMDRLPTRALVGRQLLRELLEQRATGLRHRSDLEQKVARWLIAAGLRDWQPNYAVPVGGETVEVDFAWPHARVALEVSPFFTHGSRAAQDRDAVRRRLLVAQQWRIVEATDPDLENQLAFARSVACIRDLLSTPSCAVGGSPSYLPHKSEREAM
jgi:very-short-patch-repair endonuclease